MSKKSNNAGTDNQAQFQIHKLYIKDVSFEVPNGSTTFKNEWQPELNVEINHQHKALAEPNTYEVNLHIKCMVTNLKEKAFEVEAQQAGIFSISNITDEQLDHTLKAFCPNMLYPYLREVISDLVSKGGFPQLALAPVNFDMLYEQQKADNKDKVTKH